jgi:hypothetical protein
LSSLFFWEFCGWAQPSIELGILHLTQPANLGIRAGAGTRAIWEFERWQAPTQAEKTPEKKYLKNVSPIPSAGA